MAKKNNTDEPTVEEQLDEPMVDESSDSIDVSTAPSSDDDLRLQFEALQARLLEQEKQITRLQSKATGGNNSTGGAELRVERETTAKRTQEKLDRAPKVPFLFPLGFGEKPGSAFQVQINGYTYIGRKGVQIELPAPVVKLLYKSMQGTHIATNRYLAPAEVLSGGLKG